MQTFILLCAVALLGCASVRELPSVVPAPGHIQPVLGEGVRERSLFSEWLRPDVGCDDRNPVYYTRICVTLDSTEHIRAIQWYHSGLAYAFDSTSIALVDRYGPGTAGFHTTGGKAVLWVEGDKRMCLIDQLGIERATLIVLERTQALKELGSRVSPCDEIQLDDRRAAA